MKRFFTVFLSLTCLMALCCPAFAVVECQLPQDLPGVLADVAAHDVLIIGGGPEENASPDTPVEDAPADAGLPAEPVDGKYSSMGALYQAWGGYEGYPDYVCGVWSTDGGLTNMTVAVTKDETGEQGKGEILSLLKNTDTVTFTYQSYTYGELREVNDAIVDRMMAGGSPIVSCGIYEMENKVHISVLETAENAETVAQELLEQYGDKVIVELGSEIILDTTLEKNRDRGFSGVPLVLAAAVGLTTLGFARKLPARLTNTGKVVTQQKPTRTQVEAALRESSETPTDRVEEQIKKMM